MKLPYGGTASITVLCLMLYKSDDALEIPMVRRSIQYRLYLEISSLYSNYISDSLYIPANKSNEDIS